MIDLFHHFYEDDGSFLHNFIADSLNYLNEQVKEIEVKVVEVKEAEVTEAKVKEAKVKENEGEEVTSFKETEEKIKTVATVLVAIYCVAVVI
jgi:hypothetical protein